MENIKKKSLNNKPFDALVAASREMEISNPGMRNRPQCEKHSTRVQMGGMGEMGGFSL